MSENLQPDLHPEAEILNAFAEHALSGAEQQQTLAHLAECTRCRQIVFLTQEAAAVEEHPIAATLPTPPPLSHWWSSWRILLIAAPACAALLTIAVFLNLKPATSTTQQAGVTNQPIKPAVPVASSIPRDETVEQSIEQKTPRLRDKSITNTPLPLQNPRPVPTTPGNNQPAAAVLPRPSASASTVNVTAESAAPAPIVSADAARIEPAPQPIPPMPAPSNVFTVNSSASITLQQATTAQSAAASAAPSPKAIPAPARPGSMHSISSGAISGRSIVMNRAQLQKQAFASPADAAARRILYTRLPNGLTAVSTAAVFTAATQHRLLALDTAGALFHSEDEGTTWQPITIQWTGRPLEVRAAQIPDPSSSTLSGLAPSVPDPCPTCASKPAFSPTAKFELITDAVSTFTSTDGLTWTPKSPPKPAIQTPQKSEPQK